jgi:hypothetical protein
LSYSGIVRVSIFLPGLLVGSHAVACVNTDAAVFVEPTITQTEAQVSGGVLGTGAAESGGLRERA